MATATTTTTLSSSSSDVAVGSSSSSAAAKPTMSASKPTTTTSTSTMPTVKDIMFCIVSISLGTYIMITDHSGFFTTSKENEIPLPEQWMESCVQIIQNEDVVPSLSLTQQEFDSLTTTTKFGAELLTLTNYDTTCSLGFKLYKVTICILTQFLTELVSNSSSPAGFIVWITTILIWLPLGVFMRIESCRIDAVGLVKYPTLLYVSSQLSSGGLFFRSYVIPLFYIPAWILGRGGGQNNDPINKIQTSLVLPMVLPTIILSILVFSIKQQSSHDDCSNKSNNIWISLIGLLGGPVLPLINSIVSNIVATIFPSTTSTTSSETTNLKAIKQSNDRSSLMFVLSGMIALFGWLWIVFVTTIPYYGFSIQSIYDGVLWPSSESSSSSVVLKFMTIEASVLWLSGMIILAYHNINAAIEGIFMSLCFGPGCGISLVLAGLYVDDDIQIELAKQLQEKKKMKKNANKLLMKKKKTDEKNNMKREG